MFDTVVADPGWDPGVHVPDDGYDDAVERLLAEAAGVAPEWLPDQPVESADELPGPEATYGSCVPSGWLALDLDVVTVDPARVDDHTLVEAMTGFERLVAWASARQARLFAELAARRPADRAPHTARWANVGSEYVPDEVGVALHWSRGTACARVALARRLLTVLPDTFALWEAGLIDLAKARAIDEATVVLSDEHAQKVQARVLPKAPEQTLAQLKAALARAVLAVDPKGAEERHRRARRDRRVAVTAEADGMGTVWAMLTATDAVGAYTWLTRLARGLGADDPRSMDQRRADIFGALLNGRLVVNPDDSGDCNTGSDTGSDGGDSTGEDGPCNGQAFPNVDEAASDQATDDRPAGGSTGTGGTGGEVGVAGAGRPIHPVTPGKPLIQIVIPHSTLIGADDQPCELVGHGPIPASLAREAAADGVWRRLVTDPLSGTLLDHGRTTYHPPAGLADHVRARDLYCRKPGCRRKAADGELDHVTPWSKGGTTSENNLAGYCTHDHLLKTHAPGWRVEAHPDGALTWVTPTGHRHTTRPHDYSPELPAPPPPLAPPGPATPYDPDADPPPF